MRVHPLYSGLDQCRQTFLTKLQFMRGKNHLFMVVGYQTYIGHDFLKLSAFGFRCNSHWIFQHINTFAYLNKGESCITFADIHCCKKDLSCSVGFDVKIRDFLLCFDLKFYSFDSMHKF